MSHEDIGRLALLCVVAALLLRMNLWRAILFLRPESMTLEPEAPGDQMKLPAALARTEHELVGLGFTALGSHLEKARLSKSRLNYDYVHEKEHVFATLFVSPRGESRLYFLTPTANDGFVITADHRRPAQDIPGRYLSGGMTETTAERLLNAHQRRVQSVGAPAMTPTLEARVEAARAWYRGPGQKEVRQQNALGLLWTVGSLGMVGVGFLALWR
jgi:hypothetical protein